MSLNLNQSNVSLDNPIFNPMLVNLQANILKFHGRNFAYHLFVKIEECKIEEARKWIIYFTSSKITNAYTQLYDAGVKKKDKAYDGGPVYTLSLSNYACKKLNIKSSIRENITFENGLRGSEHFLKDKLEDWEEEFRDHHIDLLIILAEDDATKAAKCANDIESQISHFCKCVKTQRGNVLKMAETKVGIEHFGYADGISQPMYLADEIKEQNKKAPKYWDDTTNLDMVLVEEKNSTEKDCFGSYLVFRKLEQNVKCFKIAEGDTEEDPNHPECKKKLPDVKGKNGEENDELAGAMIVGRFENSTPVTLSGKATMPNPTSTQTDNDFDYANDQAGSKCPFHAHIRLMNPRSGVTNANPDADPKEIRSHRITRRAIPYDDLPNKRFSDSEIVKIDEKLLKVENQPKDGVGLLFMCYQSDIANQFEELQGQWANTGEIDPSTSSIGEDSLITQGLNAPRTLPQQWNKSPQSDPFQFSGFVTMRGGEYFYTPSICFLKNL